MKYELILWYQFFLKAIPGKVGCFLRTQLLPSKIGKHAKVWDQVQIDYPSKLIVGENTSINRGCIINAGGGVEIGNNVLIGPNVTIYSQNHTFNKKSELISEQGYDYAKVTIDDDVWIASNVTILPGVTISKGAVVGAGSVVTKNVASFDVVAGVPAIKISSRK
ncbi:acyltransferase [Pseudoalteromonas sp. 2CM36K]|uniref:acyltransferase n=1 Tax=Pseudoalteromonas sp. 2CM36K TaxID=2929854 RepID=UPI0020BE4421|nr:acyltransferase [Pseudoalteromonas sp. 2CM36K]MCK8104694.1 acyltransferase [Pseudoalteromonas sp. 2CM36K]